MRTPLNRYSRPVTRSELARVLEKPDSVDTVPLERDADFTEVRRVIDGLLSQNAGDRTIWDQKLVEPLHRALRDLPIRIASDMRFWQWLCISQFQDFVRRRWGGDESGKPVSRSLAERFLGSPTLRGVSRNALARLWWCAHCLKTEEEGYGLAQTVLTRQDLFQAIFERRFCLYPPAAQACVRKYAQAGQDEWRRGTKFLNHYLTTIVVESLTENEIRSLLP